MNIVITKANNKYIMDIDHGTASGRFACSSIDDALQTARRFLRDTRYDGKIHLKVYTAGYDANGSEVHELTTDATG